MVRGDSAVWNLAETVAAQVAHGQLEEVIHVSFPPALEVRDLSPDLHRKDLCRYLVSTFVETKILETYLTEK